MAFIRHKTVTTNLQHYCPGCKRTLNQGTRMIAITEAVDEPRTIRTYHLCLVCARVLDEADFHQGDEWSDGDIAEDPEWDAVCKAVERDGQCPESRRDIVQ